MSAPVYRFDLVQGSDEWHEARRGLLTASVVGQLVTPTLKVAANADSRAITAALVAERITGFVDEGFVSADMERGWDDEPRAIAVYEKHHDRVDPCGLVVRTLDDGSRVGWSPDGLVGDTGCIEIKSRRPKKHLQTILDGAVPRENIAQIQAALFVSGRSWCDYLSYCGGMPLYAVRVYPDPAWHDAIEAAVVAFESAAAQMTDTYNRAVVGLPMTERIETDTLARIEF